MKRVDSRFWVVVQFRNFDASNVDVIVAEQTASSAGMDNTTVIFPVQLHTLDVTDVERIDEQKECVGSVNEFLAIP